MEIIFRRIEYWIEGNAYYQKKLDKQAWNFDKIWKKSLKHGIFYLIAFIIGNTFLAYIIGIEALKLIVTDSPARPRKAPGRFKRDAGFLSGVLFHFLMVQGAGLHHCLPLRPSAGSIARQEIGGYLL